MTGRDLYERERRTAGAPEWERLTPVEQHAWEHCATPPPDRDEILAHTAQHAALPPSMFPPAPPVADGFAALDTLLALLRRHGVQSYSDGETSIVLYPAPALGGDGR